MENGLGFLCVSVACLVCMHVCMYCIVPNEGTYCATRLFVRLLSSIIYVENSLFMPLETGGWMLEIRCLLHCTIQCNANILAPMPNTQEPKRATAVQR